MKVELTLPPPLWMQDETTQIIMRVLNTENDEPQTLFVGGCVRNWILNKEVHDIDLATKYTPEVVVEKLKQADIKVIPTGIDHGTVTAVLNGKPFEITTLRHDVATDGRHAEVCFTDDWLEDAKRRDFTMNTLLADISGNIYDLLGRGIEDTKARHVVFVGDAATRIREDYLRILRFFRFHAFYGHGEMNEEALKACQLAVDKISSLSLERVSSEFLKILGVDHATEILTTMFDNKILEDLSAKNYQPKILEKLCAAQLEHNAINVETRLFVLAGNKASLFDDYLRLSHAQKKFIIKLEMVAGIEFYEDEKALKKAIFYHGNDLLLQGYLLNIAKGEVKEDAKMIKVLKNWQAPKCPINGETLMKEGFVTGPDLGIELKRRTEEWLEIALEN